MHHPPDTDAARGQPYQEYREEREREEEGCDRAHGRGHTEAGEQIEARRREGEEAERSRDRGDHTGRPDILGDAHQRRTAIFDRVHRSPAPSGRKSYSLR